jgi:hypothetical protein
MCLPTFQMNLLPASSGYGLRQYVPLNRLISRDHVQEDSDIHTACCGNLTPCGGIVSPLNLFCTFPIGSRELKCVFLVFIYTNQRGEQALKLLLLVSRSKYPERWCFFFYKPEGRCFDYRQGLSFFNWPDSSSRTVTLGSTQPLTEMRARDLPGWRLKDGQCVRLIT